MIDPNWKKPRTRADMVRVLKHLRDGLVHKFLFELDRTVPYVMTFDEDDVETSAQPRPVFVIWHSIDPGSVSWNPSCGVIGPGCIIKTRLPNDQPLPVAMLQVGGVILPKKDKSVIEKRFTTTKSHWGTLVYLDVQYFVTAPMLKQYCKGAESETVVKPDTYIKDSRAQWHLVPEWVWKLVVSRMVGSYGMTVASLSRTRAKELQDLEEGMDPYRLTPDNKGE